MILSEIDSVTLQIKEALAEFGIANLSGATANKILERRADFLKL